MTHELIEIDVRILFLRYGRNQVLHAISKIGDQSLEQLEEELKAIEEKRKNRTRKKPKASLMELADKEAIRSPEKAEALRSLATRYENKVFLPNLRDVIKFLANRKVKHKKLRSRRDAGPILIRALAAMTEVQLNELYDKRAQNKDSDYSLLSRAILRDSKDVPKEK